MGPAYSTLGAAEYLVRKAPKLDRGGLTDRVDAQGTWNKPAVEFAKSKGLKGIDVHDPYPAQASYALKYVQLAGEGGGVILDFTTDQVLTVIKAAEQQGNRGQGALGRLDTRLTARVSLRGLGRSGTASSASTPSSCPSPGRGPTPRSTAKSARSTSRKWGLSSKRAVRVPRCASRHRGSADA